MHHCRVLAAFTLSVAFAGAASAQNLLSYRPQGLLSSRFYEEMAGSPVRPAPGVSVGATGAPVRPAPAALDGACAVDNEAGVVFSTNGTATIERQRYSALGCAAGPVLPALPIPAAIGNVTGMAVDPINKHLFLTNGFVIFEVNPMAGMAIVCAWPVAPINTLTGLDYDPMTPGIVYGVSSAAEVVRYSRCGVLLGVSPATYAWPGSPAVGIAMDRSTAAGGRIYVLHLNGETYEHTAGVLFSTVMPNRRGLSYIASASVVPGAAPCGGATPTSHLDELAMEGQAAFAMRVCDVPPAAAGAALLVDFALGFPVPFCASSIWLPGAPIVVPAPVIGTTASVPLPLPIGSAGWRFYTQWAVPCLASPCGVVMTHAHQIEVSR